MRINQDFYKSLYISEYLQNYIGCIYEQYHAEISDAYSKRMARPYEGCHLHHGSPEQVVYHIKKYLSETSERYGFETPRDDFYRIVRGFWMHILCDDLLNQILYKKCKDLSGLKTGLTRLLTLEEAKTLGNSSSAYYFSGHDHIRTFSLRANGRMHEGWREQRERYSRNAA